MDNMKKIFTIILMSLALFAMPLSVSSSAYAGNCASSGRFLTFPTWYRGQTVDGLNGTCNIKSPTNDAELSKFVWSIVLNIIEILSQAVVYVTIGMILYGGFQYLTSAGSADAMKKGKTTITNAIIGLIISLVAVAAVNLIVGILGK